MASVSVRRVKIDWTNLKAIKQAERAKTRLENKGYSLKHTYSRPNGADLVYMKKID